MATTTAADPPEASAPRIVVQDPPPAADGLEEPAASSTTTLEPPPQQPNMGLSAGATTFLVLLLATLYLAWDARRRRRQRRGGQDGAGLDRMHPARRERLEAEQRERLREAEQKARRLAALRAKRFGPADSGRPGAPAIPDADLLAGRQPFPFDALPATATLQVAAEAEPSSTSSTVPDPASYMVCTPLDTVEELWAWTPAPGCLAPKAFILPYQPPPRAVQHEALRRGQLLVCHDMKGGYHSDRYCFGPSCAWADEGGDGVAFRLYQWDLIDALIYFTHRFITVPPPGWTALCHRHGVKALGTFITEWDAGREKCRRVFESQETVERCVEQMVAITVHHGFEGWLINIENPIDWEGGTGLIVTFLELLTRRMREVLPAADPDGPSPALVLWYDSVTHDTGELKWQDALNERNEAFFRACDGIFTNYCWKQEEPARSAARADAAEGGASSRSRRWDVFMGIDCFGRNTYGGGGFDCDVALRAIRQAGVSAALFAPGWVWEDQVEGARRRARGEGKEEAAAAAAEEQEGEAVQEAAESQAAVVAAVEKEEWGWRRVEGEFEATQERFWAKIGAMWPRRPLPADLSEPFLSNFGTGVGLHVWDGGVRLTPAFTPANASTGGDFAPGPGTTSSGSHVKPFYNLAMQDALPLALTHCSRACIKQAPTAPTKAPPGGGRVSGRIGDEDDSAAASADASSCPPGLGASTSYRTAYRGGSSLCVSGLLQPGAGATRATLPLYQLDAPASGMALEVRVVYKAPHSTREDDFCLELVLQGEGASKASSGAVEAQAPAETVGAIGRLRAVLDATTTTTHVILRPPAEEGDAEGGGGNSSSSWGSKRVGKVLETSKGSRRTRKVFYAPVLDSPPAEAEANQPITTSEQALAATVAQARAQAHASAPSLESVYEEAALEALPWRQRVFRVRDLALEGARIKELRLVCLKKPLQSNGGSDGLPLPYCLFLGELSVGHVRKPPPPPSGATTPRPGPTSLLLNPVDGTPALRCARLELHLAHWDPTARRLSGQLTWEWEGGDDDAANRRLLADTDVLLFCPGLCKPVWVGRAFAPAFALSVALPEGDYESVRLVLQPRDRLGSVLPICSCPSLAVEVKA